MTTIEAQLRQELCDYAVELRKLAYTLPHGVGEHDLLWLSERMRTAADQVVPRGVATHFRSSRRQGARANSGPITTSWWPADGASPNISALTYLQRLTS